MAHARGGGLRVAASNTYFQGSTAWTRRTSRSREARRGRDPRVRRAHRPRREPHDLAVAARASRCHAARLRTARHRRARHHRRRSRRGASGRRPRRRGVNPSGRFRRRACSRCSGAAPRGDSARRSRSLEETNAPSSRPFARASDLSACLPPGDARAYNCAWLRRPTRGSSRCTSRRRCSARSRKRRRARIARSPGSCSRPGGLLARISRRCRAWTISGPALDQGRSRARSATGAAARRRVRTRSSRNPEIKAGIMGRVPRERVSGGTRRG
jgi:hypothetical protein